MLLSQASIRAYILYIFHTHAYTLIHPETPHGRESHGKAPHGKALHGKALHGKAPHITHHACKHTPAVLNSLFHSYMNTLTHINGPRVMSYEKNLDPLRASLSLNLFLIFLYILATLQLQNSYSTDFFEGCFAKGRLYLPTGLLSRLFYDFCVSRMFLVH